MRPGRRQRGPKTQIGNEVRRYQHQISATNERPEVSSSQFTNPKQSEPLTTNRFNLGNPGTTKRSSQASPGTGIWC